MLAPDSTRNLIMAVLPFIAAECKGVLLLLSWTLIMAPF